MKSKLYTSSQLLDLQKMLDTNKQTILDYYSRINNSDTPSYKNGSKIKIKKKNEGKFTDSANRAGMSVQQFAAHVLANKDKYSSTLVKRANFARNASKWNH